MSNPVVVAVGLVTVVIAIVSVLCVGGYLIVRFLLHLWKEGKTDGTTWRLGLVLFVVLSIAKACLSKGDL